MLVKKNWIRFGRVYPQVLLRVWRTDQDRLEQLWMDKHAVPVNTKAKTVIAKNHLVDDNRKGFSFWIDKHNKYASREMAELLNLKYALFAKDGIPKKY